MKKMNNNIFPVKIGIIGMGGFARAHHSSVLELEKKGKVKLICTCDVFEENIKSTWQQFFLHDRNVKIFRNYIDMLDECSNDLDFVCIPTPVHLHAEMHQQCIKRSIPVYLEKPPTLDYQQLLEMMEIDRTIEKKTNVGFNFIIQKERHQIKQRILSGEFGKVKKITFTGLWPRYASYFKRSNWAGRLMLDNRIVLDSCFGNALSHFVHNILFWCGKQGIFSWDPVVKVESELYRANKIQGTDTVFVRASTKNVEDIRIAITHACSEKTPDIEKIYCEKAKIFFEGNARCGDGLQVNCSILWNNGKEEKIKGNYQNILTDNIDYYTDYITGTKERVLTLLSDTEPFVMLNGLIYVAAQKITQIPDSFINIVSESGDTLTVINDIQKISENFIEKGLFPSEQKLPWASKGGCAFNRDIKDLHQIIKKISE